MYGHFPSHIVLLHTAPTPHRHLFLPLSFWGLQRQLAARQARGVEGGKHGKSNGKSNGGSNGGSKGESKGESKDALDLTLKLRVVDGDGRGKDDALGVVVVDLRALLEAAASAAGTGRLRFGQVCY